MTPRGAALLTILLIVARGVPAWADDAAATADPVVATWRGGSVLTSDVEGWSRYIELDRGTKSRLDLRGKVQEIVVERALAARFDRTPSAAGEDFRIRREQLRWRLADRALRRHLLAGCAPSEAQIAAAYRTRLPTLRQPKRWQLEDIFKAYPDGATEAQKEAVLASVRDIERRLRAGADFGRTARAESESSTRLRDGSMGTLSLERLAAPLAEAVARMKAGELSEPVVLPRGVAIVRCLQVFEASEPTLAETRDNLAASLRTECFEPGWQAVTARALAALGARSAPDPGSPEVAVFAQDAATARELQSQGPAAAGRELLALEARAGEAERLGLTRTPEHELVRRWRETELKAQLMGNEAGRALIVEPTQAELRADFDSNPAGWVEPRRHKIALLRLPLKRDLPESFYERARTVARDLQRNGGRLDEAAARLAPHAQVKDLGRMTDDEVWALGVNVDAAVRNLKPGGFSGLLQEGPWLVIVHLVERTEERRLDFAQAGAYVRAVALERRRQEAGRRLREQVLAEEAVRMGPGAP